MVKRSQEEALAAPARASGDTLLSFRELADLDGSTSPDALYAADFAKMVEVELLPRLLVAFQSDEAPAGQAVLSPSDHEAFLRVIVDGAAGEATSFVRALEARGVPQDAIYTELFTGAARTLGLYWQADTADFATVTLGLARLQRLLRQGSIVGDFRRRAPVRAAGRILLTVPQGEQHTMGVLIAAEVFRRDGWFVASEPGTKLDSLLQLISAEAFDVIGLSASTSRSLGQMYEEVQAMRRVSSNPDVVIMVGGFPFMENPDLAEQVGATLCVTDVMTAPALCRSCLKQAGLGR